MGGILIWAATLFVTLAVWGLARFAPGPLTLKLDFLAAARRGYRSSRLSQARLSAS